MVSSVKFSSAVQAELSTKNFLSLFSYITPVAVSHFSLLSKYIVLESLKKAIDYSPALCAFISAATFKYISNDNIMYDRVKGYFFAYSTIKVVKTLYENLVENSPNEVTKDESKDHSIYNAAMYGANKSIDFSFATSVSKVLCPSVNDHICNRFFITTAYNLGYWVRSEAAYDHYADIAITLLFSSAGIYSYYRTGDILHNAVVKQSNKILARVEAAILINYLVPAMLYMNINTQGSDSDILHYEL